MHMKRVRIAELKAHVSKYLRDVRKGQSVVVLDRETLVAEIVPRSRTIARLPLRRKHME
jgi:antitoxin (DNA-binding transcriptional repressor) of toxin-antitoxin stability system